MVWYNMVPVRCMVADKKCLTGWYGTMQYVMVYVLYHPLYGTFEFFSRMLTVPVTQLPSAPVVEDLSGNIASWTLVLLTVRDKTLLSRSLT